MREAAQRTSEQGVVGSEMSDKQETQPDSMNLDQIVADLYQKLDIL